MLTVVIGILGAGNLCLLFSVVTVACWKPTSAAICGKRMENKSKLKGITLLCGFGRVGRNIAELGQLSPHFVAIVKWKTNCWISRRKSGPALPERRRQRRRRADRGGHQACQGRFAVTGDDSRNPDRHHRQTLRARSARRLPRCHEAKYRRCARPAPTPSSRPNFTGGMRIASAMIRLNVVSFLDEMLLSEKNRIEEIPVPTGFIPKALGRPQTAQLLPTMCCWPCASAMAAGSSARTIQDFLPPAGFSPDCDGWSGRAAGNRTVADRHRRLSG